MKSSTKLLLGFIGLAVILTGVFFIVKNSAEASLPDGGHCEYDTLLIPAKVVAIDFFKDDMAEVYVTIGEPGDFTDTLRYSKEYPYQAATAVQLREAGIAEGDTIQCIMYKRMTGSCTPYDYVPLLKKFGQEE